MFKKIRRYITMIIVMKRGPKFHLGDVVDVNDNFDSVGNEAILGTRFRHKNKYGDIINTYEYDLNGAWYREHRLKKVVESEENYDF